MSQPVELTVESSHGTRSIRVPPEELGVRLSEVLRRDNLPLNTRCGQRGLCDGCIIELVHGRLVHVISGAVVTADGRPIAVRGCEHACHAGHAGTSLVIRIPERSLLAHEPQVLTDFAINVTSANDPLVRDPDRDVGIAIDIGTTTVVVMAVDMADGRVLGKAADFNQQMHLGDDVLTRINLCFTDPAMLDKLQRAVVRRTIDPLIMQSLDSAGRSVADIACVAVAANTTMLHLLAGIDPSPMGVAPFTPNFLEHRVMSCRQVGLQLAPSGPSAAAPTTNHDPPLHLLPSAAAYVGADLVAGIFASGLFYDDGPSLLVDIGTNGEIIAKHGDRLLGCATAAGPAFEGSKLSSGMRAAAGAIAHVAVNTGPFKVITSVIGDTKPLGMCGSAYVDLLAQLRGVGLLTATGRLSAAGCPDGADRLTKTEYGQVFHVERGQGGRDIVVSELDIVSLLQAKAAIAAGILTLIERLGLTPAKIKTLYLAGGFGMHLNIPNAIAAGMLPGFVPEQIKLVGNTSLAGAYLTLLDKGVLDDLAAISKKMDVVELNLDPNFESCYIDNLSLP